MGIYLKNRESTASAVFFWNSVALPEIRCLRSEIGKFASSPFYLEK